MPDKDQFPEICGWFGVRRHVMRGAMKEIKKLEAEGVPVTSKKFSEIMKKRWEDVKKEQERVCSLGQSSVVEEKKEKAVLEF